MWTSGVTKAFLFFLWSLCGVLGNTIDCCIKLTQCPSLLSLHSNKHNLTFMTPAQVRGLIRSRDCGFEDSYPKVPLGHV